MLAISYNTNRRLTVLRAVFLRGLQDLELSLYLCYTKAEMKVA